MEEKNRINSINKEEFFDFYYENNQELNNFNSVNIYTQSEDNYSKSKYNIIYLI